MFQSFVLRFRCVHVSAEVTETVGEVTIMLARWPLVSAKWPGTYKSIGSYYVG